MTETQATFQERFADYQPIDGAYDEALSQGQLRLPYAAYLKELDRIGRDEFARRWSQAQRTVRDNGIAYSGRSDGAPRPRFWTLDALPVLVQEDEWNQVQQAIGQRARLMNLALRDLYGPQRLLKEGILPTNLIYSDPGFLRSCKTPETESNTTDFLNLYAADIARAPNGKWWLLADRTEAPSGLGYALEHRIVMSRMLPRLVREMRIRRLAPFFVTLQNRLTSLASRHRDNPRIVFLSEGPANPYHIEDAYLSRYLGWLLVEDGDLAVRGSKVMLKTLGGLKPIDVVLRNQNSIDCDPLEANTSRGIAGLTQAVRANEVAVTNRLGSGMVESAAYMAYAPQMCRALLDEDLLIPNVATWWCGDQRSKKFVLDNLQRLVVVPAFRSRGNDTSLRSELMACTPEQLTQRIHANPSAYAAQEQVQRSSAPLWGLQPRSHRLAIRTYAASEPDNDSFHVMDGGLARLSSTLEPLEISIRGGEKSKDIWVLSDKPVRHVSLLSPPGQESVIRRTGDDLPSRVADNLFWLGRRLERTDDHARLIGTTAKRLIGELAYHEIEDMPMLLRCLAAQGLIEPGYAMTEMREPLPNVSLELAGFVFENRPDSLASGIERLVRLGYLVRDRLSAQNWTIIRQIESLFPGEMSGHYNLADIVQITEDLQTLLAAFAGIVIDGMTRTQVFQFLDLGRRIERSQQILDLLNHGILHDENHKPNRTELETTLELMQSLMTYRSRYLAQVHQTGVIDLVVCDETNPRSLAYQFLRAQQHIDQLPRSQETVGLSAEQRTATNLMSQIRTLDIETESISRGENSMFRRWEKDLHALANSLSHRYLVHATSQQLTDIRDD